MKRKDLSETSEGPMPKLGRMQQQATPPLARLASASAVRAPTNPTPFTAISSASIRTLPPPPLTSTSIGTARLSYSSSKGRAVPLIQFTTSVSTDGKSITKYELNEEGMAILRALDSELAVITVAGKYRTGKSLLMNRGILGLRGGSGFSVGPTTQPCTRGIWIFSEPVDCCDPVTGRQYKGVVMDSEGIGSTDANVSHDARIFALSLLLSSKFIFNAVGAIDEASLSNLNLVADLSNNIKVNSQSDIEDVVKRDDSVNISLASMKASSASSSTYGMNGGDSDEEDNFAETKRHINNLLNSNNGVPKPLSSVTSTMTGKSLLTKQEIELGQGDYFPDFLWVARDFSLLIRDEHNNTLSSKEYLEKALRDPGPNTDVDKRRLRELLSSYFRNRDCVTLVRPCNDESALQQLDTIPDDELRPEFVAQLQSFRLKALSSPPKTICGKPINGFMLAKLCEIYVEAINNDKAPAIRESWAVMSESQCKEAKNMAIKLWRKNANDKQIWILSSESLIGAFSELRQQAEKDYRRAAFGACTDEVLQSVFEEISESELEYKKRNADHVSSLISREVEMIASQIGILTSIEQLQQLILRAQSKIAKQFDSSKSSDQTFSCSIMEQVLEWCVSIGKRQDVQIKSMEERVAEQSAFCKSLQQKLDVALEESHLLETERDAELAELKKQLTDSNENNAKFMEEYKSGFNTQTQIAESKITQLQSDLKDARERLEVAETHAMENMGCQASEVGEKDKKIEELTIEVDNLKHQKEQLDDEIAQVNANMDLYIEQARFADVMQMQCRKAETQTARLQKELTELREQAVENEGRLKDQLKVLQDEFTTLSEETSDMHSQENDQMLKQLTETRRAATDSESKRHGLEQQLSTAQRQLQEVTRTEDRMSSRLAKELESVKSEVLRLNELKTKLKDEYESRMNAICQKQNEEVATIREEKVQLEQQRSKERSDLTAKLKKAEYDALTANARLEDAKKKENSEDEKSRKDLRSDITRLRLDLSKAESALQYMTQEKSKIEGELLTEQSKAKKFETQVKELQQTMDMKLMKAEFQFEKKLLMSKRT